jgi:hypothetical protein
MKGAAACQNLTRKNEFSICSEIELSFLKLKLDARLRRAKAGEIFKKLTFALGVLPSAVFEFVMVAP